MCIVIAQADYHSSTVVPLFVRHMALKLIAATVGSGMQESVEGSFRVHPG